MNFYSIRLLAKSPVADETMRFEFEKPAGFHFKAGQFLELVIPEVTDDSRGKSREFSIASSPHESNLMIATRLTNSPFKNFFSNAPIGTKIKIQGPFGNFIIPEDAHRLLIFLAGGIGVTPFRSMIKYASEEKTPHKIFLFYSNRRPEDAVFLEELNNLQLTTNNFKFIPTMTKPELSKKPWAGGKGHINKEMISKFLDNFDWASYYITGPPAFAAAMWQMLKLAGASAHDIKTEEFVGYSLVEAEIRGF